MNTSYTIIVSVLCGVAWLLVCIRLAFKYIQKRLEKHIVQNFNQHEIISATTNANFFGFKSIGYKQIRGNGAIVLTKEALCFVRALPFQEHIIPLDKVKEISLPTSFNGRSIFKKLLCVHYQVGGQEEAIAWAVNSPEKWKVSIENIIQNR